jgi:hypothetical protein
MYAISDPARPHLVLAIAETLDAIADALAATMPSDVVVYVSQDGHSHDLNAAEQAELDGRVRARRPPSGEATTERPKVPRNELSSPAPAEN